VTVVVTTSAGSAISTVTLGQFGPSFSVLHKRYVAGSFSGLTVRDRTAQEPTTSSARGYSFGYLTVAAVPGDIVELFGWALDQHA